MRCAACGGENRAGARFCNECGAALAATCAACGQENTPGSRFCDACGQPLTTAAPSVVPIPEAAPSSLPPQGYIPRHLAEKILAGRDALQGERKLVTVLFADVVGSTELIRDRDPEEAQRLLDGAVTQMMAAVHRYEGTVSRLMGDGLMAMFGAPVAHEDHALRGCYAALAMLDACRAYAEDVRLSTSVAIQVRVGLNSGEVVVRLISDDLHMDYTAMGQTVHLASRMETLAAPGTALLSPATLALVEGYVETRPLGLMEVKGLAEPVAVATLVGAGAARTRLEAASARGLTPFVGRHEERGAIDRALPRAQAGHGQVVALVGEPGVGESRLAYEVMRAASAAGWRVLESGARWFGAGTPYLPVIDLIKRACRIEDGDSAETTRGRFASRVRALDPELGPILPPLLALLDLPVDDPAWSALPGPARRRATLDAVLQLLRSESRERPLLVLVEDLHWLDSESQALLDNLVESLTTARILLVVDYRPEYTHGWGNKSYYVQVRMDPLSGGSADALLRSLLGGDAGLDSLKRLLLERTGGNPFFLEESVRTLVEIGALVGRRGAYVLTQDVPSLVIPSTVQAMLAARIDRLDPVAKRLLQMAAVIGRDVPCALLQAVARTPDAELDATLSRLQAAELLYAASLFPDPAYSFSHALTHDVAYGGLLREQRRTLHAAIVEAMEGLYPERTLEHVERLAEHAFRGELWEKAVQYGRQAGLKTQALSAHREAVAHFEQAIVAQRSLADDDASPERLREAIDLRLALRTSLIPLSDLPRVYEVLLEAELTARTLGDRLRLGYINNYLTSYFLRDGQPHLAIVHARSALDAANALDNFDLRATARFHLGLCLHDLGELRASVATYRENVETLVGNLAYGTYGQAGLPAAMSWADMAKILAELGEFAEARTASGEAERIAAISRNAWSIGSMQWRAGILHLLAGEIHEAVVVLERGVALCEEQDFPLFLPSMSSALGRACMLAGDTERGLKLLEAAVKRGEAIVQEAEHAHRLAWLAEAYLQVGEVERALPLAQEAVEVAGSTGKRLQYAHALRALADVLALRGGSFAAEAEQRFRETLALSAEMGTRPIEAHCHLGLGKLYRHIGRPDEARAELAQAVAMLRDMGMTFWLPEAEAELAQVGSSGSGL